MTHDDSSHSHPSTFAVHAALAMVLLVGGTVATLWPAARDVVWMVTAASVAVHLGFALVALLGIRWFVRAHRRPSVSMGQGKTIRWAFLYDVLVSSLSFGQEGAFRRATLERAGVTVGEKVLDVGCGTGTLALAAKQRVGATGTVNGVDYGAEMVARARKKAADDGLDVVFEVAPAQQLPFADASFDVVLCTMMIHHLPKDGRVQAIAEMRRVLRQGGRLLVVDLAQATGIWALLDPISLVHGRRDMNAAAEAAQLMRAAGFSRVENAQLGSRTLGFARGQAD